MSARPSRAPDAPSATAGFTLLEMMVALVIVGLVLAAGMAAIARRDMTPTPLQAAQRMQAMFLLARSDAIREGGDTAVLVDVASRSFAYPADAEPMVLPDRLGVRMLAGAEVMAEGGRALVVFRADGGSSGAEIFVTGAGVGQVRIEIPWLTGLARLSSGAPG